MYLVMSPAEHKYSLRHILVRTALQEQLQEWMSQVPDASKDANVRNDIFSEVLGPEPRGRVRGLGLGASQSVWSQPSTRAGSSSNEDKATIASLQTKVNELQVQLQWMMEMWQWEHPGSHPPGSHPPDYLSDLHPSFLSVYPRSLQMEFIPSFLLASLLP